MMYKAKSTTEGCKDGSGEEISHVQGKRNPSKMVDVARGQTH